MTMKEVLIGIIMALLVLAVGFYIFQTTIDTTLIEHPEATQTQIGAPLEFNWVVFVVTSILAIIIVIIRTTMYDDGIFAIDRQP